MSDGPTEDDKRQAQHALERHAARHLPDPVVVIDAAGTRCLCRRSLAARLARDSGGEVRILGRAEGAPPLRPGEAAILRRRRP